MSSAFLDHFFSTLFQLHGIFTSTIDYPWHGVLLTDCEGDKIIPLKTYFKKTEEYFPNQFHRSQARQPSRWPDKRNILRAKELNRRSVIDESFIDPIGDWRGRARHFIARLALLNRATSSIAVKRGSSRRVIRNIKLEKSAWSSRRFLRG